MNPRTGYLLGFATLAAIDVSLMVAARKSQWGLLVMLVLAWLTVLGYILVCGARWSEQRRKARSHP